MQDAKKSSPKEKLFIVTSRTIDSEVFSSLWHPSHFQDAQSSVLLHPNCSAWIIINPTGREIATDLFSGIAPDQIADRLSKSYGIPKETAQADTERMMRELSAAGLFPLSLSQSPAPRRDPCLKNLSLQLTNHCNLRCPHCWVDANRDKHQELPLHVVRLLVDQLIDAGGTGITLSGGEPLLHPDFSDILDHIGNRLTIRLLTNGTLIDSEWAQRFTKLDIYIQISMDGSCPQIHDSIRGTGAFDRSIRAIHLLQEFGLGDRLNLSTTIMDANLQNLPNIILMAEDIGISLVRFLPLRQLGRAKRTWDGIAGNLSREAHEQFYERISRQRKCIFPKTITEISCGLSGFVLKVPETDGIWCPIGHKMEIMENGDAYPCGLLICPEFYMGNVFQKSLRELMASPGMAAACRLLVERRTIGTCGACTFRNLCQGGCMGLAMDHTGDVQNVDDFCQYRKSVYVRAFDELLVRSEESEQGKPV